MSTATHTHHEHSHATSGGCGSGGCGSGGCSTQSAPKPMAELNYEPVVMKSYVTDPMAADAPIKLSDKAAIEIKRFMSEKNVPEGCVLRIAVLAGGCSGFQEHLGFDVRVNEEADHISEQYGIRVAIDKKFLMFLGGTTIDYLDGIDKRGFKFDNPNAKGSCGCGKSFSV